MDIQAPWLNIIGIGEDGIEGLSSVAQKIIRTAEYVIGGARHIDLVHSLITGIAEPWKKPFSDGITHVLSLRGTKVVILASGDPFDYGVGSVLARLVNLEELCCIPSISSISLACAKLGWARQEVRVVSLCGRPLETLGPNLRPCARIIILSADGSTPQKVYQYLVQREIETSTFCVMESLAGKDEHISFWKKSSDISIFSSLNIIAIEIKKSNNANFIPLSSGISDDLFEHDGQITKREIRAITLSTLGPQEGEVLWDIGAGAGSIAIEWMLKHPSNKAFAVEKDSVRSERIMRNGLALGTPNIEVIQKNAIEAIETLPLPNAVFVGGGLTEKGLFGLLRKILPKGTRLVVNAVTLQGEALLAEQYHNYGGDLFRIGIERLSPVGKLDAFRPAMRVTQYFSIIS